MRTIMKRVALLITIVILLVSCKETNPKWQNLDKYDGLLVKDSKGKAYLIKHDIGRFYVIIEIKENIKYESKEEKERE